MRTTILTKLADKLGLTDEIVHRDYYVYGEIVFKLCDHKIEVDQGFLKAMIVQVAGSFPWHDQMPPMEESPVGGMHPLFDGYKKVNNWHVLEVEWWFTINPCREDMKKGQLQAYENHLAKLASELASMNLQNVCEVRSLIHIKHMDSFPSNMNR